MTTCKNEFFDSLWESQSPAGSEQTRQSNNARQSDPSISLNETLRYVEDVFDTRIALATEAVLSTKATLLLANVKSCSGLVIIGPSGGGKTTTFNLIKPAQYHGQDLVYWSDDVTPAAFVSADPSADEEELKDRDLLPKIRQKSLVNPDMAGWFSGSEEQVHAIWAKIARVMDGEGLKRNTGAHGERGYEGEYRFNLLGATTPLDARAWDSMGTVGNRVVFHSLPRKEDLQAISEDVFGGDEYGEKVEQCQSVVTPFLEAIWAYHGGYSSISWPGEANPEVQEAITYLGNLVAHCRSRDGQFSRESPQRIVGSLRDIARGHALLERRQEIQSSDLVVCGRIALSTMHKERRGPMGAILNPDTPNPISSSQLYDREETSQAKKTLRKCMFELEELGLGEVMEPQSGTEPQKFKLYDKFVWPDYLDYPALK